MYNKQEDKGQNLTDGEADRELTKSLLERAFDGFLTEFRAWPMTRFGKKIAAEAMQKVRYIYALMTGVDLYEKLDGGDKKAIEVVKERYGVNEEERDR